MPHPGRKQRYDLRLHRATATSAALALLEVLPGPLFPGDEVPLRCVGAVPCQPADDERPAAGRPGQPGQGAPHAGPRELPRANGLCRSRDAQRDLPGARRRSRMVARPRPRHTADLFAVGAPGWSSLGRARDSSRVASVRPTRMTGAALRDADLADADAGLAGAGLAGSILVRPGFTGREFTGTGFTAAQSAGPQSAGPQSAGPRSAGPRSVGPRSAEPRSAGVRSTGVTH
jgi:hypothetical protein